MLLLLYDFPGVECGYDHSLPLEHLRTTNNQQSGIKSSRNHNDGAENFETAALKQNDSSVEESLCSFGGTGKATMESQGISIDHEVCSQAYLCDFPQCISSFYQESQSLISFSAFQ